mmetsp:Transcript_2017/g.5601  ORF Transcript_2017/g.5601 Transcript_2017/m.5601 type:complete len:689 (+) Transcript_2017:597-2663(+)
MYAGAEEFQGAAVEGLDAERSIAEQLQEIQDEEEARHFMDAVARRQYNAPLVRLKRDILRALGAACCHRGLLRAGAFTKRIGGDGAVKTAPRDFLRRLLHSLAETHERQPSRSHRVLDASGRPRSYAPKKYAADFLANPLGDFLLQDHDAGASQEPSRESEKTREATKEGATTLELYLEVVLACARHANSARILHAGGLLEQLRPLFDYASPNVLLLAGKVCAAAAEGCKGVEESICGEDAHVVPLTGMVLSEDMRSVHLGADALTGLIHTCSGDDFAFLTSAAGALDRCFWLLLPLFEGDPRAGQRSHASPVSTAEMKTALGRAFMYALERARQGQFGSSTKPGLFPKGGCWDLIGRERMDRVEALIAGRPQAPRQAPPSAAEGAPSLRDRPPKSQEPGAPEVSAPTEKGGQGQLRGGFLSRRPARRTAAGRRRVREREQAQAQAPGVGHPSEEVAVNATASPTSPLEVKEAKPGRADWPQHPPAAKEKVGEGAEEEEEALCDEDGLRVVWDSAPSSKVREARVAWANMDHGQKLRWSQTSSDVHAFVKVPEGTRAKDVEVKVTSTRLTVKLGWYGRVFDGPLSRRCKAGESWWLLEDTEVHVLIPKDDPHFWRSLFEGGEKKSHYEILQELVNADEPCTPYDELDEKSKDLIDEIQERQQLIAEGLIDPEGFDDFRCVIGENEQAI